MRLSSAPKSHANSP
jgi:hypothetical protein